MRIIIITTSADSLELMFDALRNLQGFVANYNGSFNQSCRRIQEWEHLCSDKDECTHRSFFNEETLFHSPWAKVS